VPIEILCVLAAPFTLLSFLLGLFLHDCFDKRLAVVVFILWLFSLTFVVIDFNFNFKETDEEFLFVNKTIENIDFIVDDGEFINLNALLSKDIKEGQKIKKKVKTYKSILSNTTRVTYEVCENEEI